MKMWSKSLGIACLLESLVACGTAAAHFANPRFLKPGILSFLAVYHMFAISLASISLHVVWTWHGPTSEPVRTPAFLEYALVFVFQVLLTAPIVYGVLFCIARARRSKG